MNLSRRTNDYFIQFVGVWLKSDAIASHFVFELGGFEFLLDTIGKKEEVSEKTLSKPGGEARPQPKKDEQIDSHQTESGHGIMQIDSGLGGPKEEELETSGK